MLASGWSVFRGLDPFGLAAVIVATIAAAIVAGGMIYAACWMYKIYLIHRERVKMIERGMDPGPFVEDAEEYRMVQEAREGEGGGRRGRGRRGRTAAGRSGAGPNAGLTRRVGGGPEAAIPGPGLRVESRSGPPS